MITCGKFLSLVYKGRPAYVALLWSSFRQDYPPKLHRLQTKYWDPLFKWIKEEFDVTLQTSNVVRAPPQLDTEVEKLMAYFEPLPSLHMAALDTVADVTRSALISVAFAENMMTVKEAWEACRVDENYQIREYGKVEGIYGHGIDMEYVRMKLAAARVVFNCLPPPRRLKALEEAMLGPVELEEQEDDVKYFPPWVQRKFTKAPKRKDKPILAKGNPDAPKQT